MTNVLLGKAQWALDAEIAATVSKFHLEIELTHRVAGDGYIEFYSPEHLADSGRLFLRSVEGVAVGGFQAWGAGLYRQFEHLDSIGVTFTWVTLDSMQRGAVVALQEKDFDGVEIHAYFKGKGFVAAGDIEYDNSRFSIGDGLPLGKLPLLSQREFESALTLVQSAPVRVEPDWDVLNESLRNFMDATRDDYQREYEDTYGADGGYDFEFSIEASHWEIDALAGLSDAQIERFWEQSEYEKDELGLLHGSVNTHERRWRRSPARNDSIRDGRVIAAKADRELGADALAGLSEYAGSKWSWRVAGDSLWIDRFAPAEAHVLARQWLNENGYTLKW